MPQLVAYLRLSSWDANIFQGCLSTLTVRASSLPDDEKRELFTAIEQVWDMYYPIGEEQDLAFDVGLLLYEMAYYTQALDYFERSLRLYGPNPGTSLNRSLCYYNLSQFDAALLCVDDSLVLRPDFEIAQSIRQTILDEMGKIASE